jgi:hypothetical protein
MFSLPRSSRPRPRRACRARTSARTTSSLAAALLAASCGGPSGYTEATFSGVNSVQVVEAFKKVVGDEGFRIEEEDAEAGVVSTHWQNEMAMTWGDGTRRKVVLRTGPAAAGTAVSLQVPLEYNKEFRAPLDPERASWEEGGRDADTEALLLMRLRMKLGILRPN